MTEYCTYSGCGFVAEPDDDSPDAAYVYSPYCINCGRRDPMAELVLTKLERRQDALDALESDWTQREDGDYTYTDTSGNEFFIRVLPQSVADGKPYMLLRTVRPNRWEVIASFESVVDAVLRSWDVARNLRLKAAGVPDEPPF